MSVETESKKKYHAERHQQLHKHLDELAADFLYHNKDKMLAKATILDLIQWSYKQTTNPDEL